nr:hypothetical protein [Tanacetum cinerariifolium]
MVIDSLRAVTFRDKYGVQMIMRFNEIHKFSDDTLHQIDEALDYLVKKFKVNRMNLGLNTRKLYWWKSKRGRLQTSATNQMITSSLPYRSISGDIYVLYYTMADVNARADQAPTMSPPTRNDDQILPHTRWLPIGKSNCYLDIERSQSNPIYKIVLDILKHTNFFRAFTASSIIPSIYI